MSNRRGKFLDLLAHSILGAADVYNLLPVYIVEAATIKEFQHRLQAMVCAAANYGVHEWQDMYSPRPALHAHLVKEWFTWNGGTVQKPTEDGVGTVGTLCITAWLNFGS